MGDSSDYHYNVFQHRQTIVQLSCCYLKVYRQNSNLLLGVTTRKLCTKSSNFEISGGTFKREIAH